MSDTTTEKLIEKFGEDLFSTTDNFRGEETIVLEDNSRLIEVCQYLKDDLGFKMFNTVTAADYYPEEPRFHLSYQLTNIKTASRLRLRVLWTDGEDAISSVAGLWKAANWHEREMWDMFGIELDGHPDLRRLMMPDDWQGHPLRRDYPLGYETVQFSFNYDEIQMHKPFAKE